MKFTSPEVQAFELKYLGRNLITKFFTNYASRSNIKDLCNMLDIPSPMGSGNITIHSYLCSKSMQ